MAATDEGLLAVGLRVSGEFLSAEPLDEDGAIINERQRYELWATSLGLYHRGHSSLDYRLRDAPLLLNYTLGLLHDLENNLCKYARDILDERQGETSRLEDDVADGSEDDSEEDFSSYLDRPLSVVLISNIVATVDRLYRLAFKIRNPSMRLGLSKALKYTERDSETGVDVIEKYAAADLDHLTDLFRSYGHHVRPQSGQLHYLVQRLAKANTRRRQQFKYWRKRRLKFETVTKPPPDETPLPNINEISPHDLPEPLDVHFGQLVLAVPSQPSTATWLDPAKVDIEDDTSAVTTTSFVALSDEKHGDIVTIPSPPWVHPGAKEFQCPYCCTICPAKTFSERSWE